MSMASPYPILNIFGRPTAEQLAARELAEARIQLLGAQSAAEFAQASVQYNQQRVARLEAMLSKEPAGA